MTKITDLITHSTQHIVRDRPYMLLMGGVLGLGVVYIAYTLLAIHSSDIQVITRYSGVGDVHFYKDKWYHLYELTLFGACITLIHGAIMAKLHEMEHRDAGIVFGWMALTMMVIVFSYTYGLLHLAFL